MRCTVPLVAAAPPRPPMRSIYIGWVGSAAHHAYYPTTHRHYSWRSCGSGQTGSVAGPGGHSERKGWMDAGGVKVWGRVSKRGWWVDGGGGGEREGGGI